LNAIWITPFFNCNFFWCMCTHPIDPMVIHLLCCIRNNEHTRTHDVIRDTFAAITWDVNFHMGWKQLHSFFLITFNSFLLMNRHCVH
jgi:hypothetical protein